MSAFEEFLKNNPTVLDRPYGEAMAGTRRDIASIPRRSAAQTWQAIVDLIVPAGSADAATLTAAASVMETLMPMNIRLPCRS